MESIGEVPSNVLEFNPNTLNYVRKVYNLDQPGRMDEAINILEEWIKKQDHIVKKDFSRSFLERVIILNKGQLERVKTNFDTYCTKRTLMPQYFGVHNVKEYKEFEPAKELALPKLTPDHHRCFLIHIDRPFEKMTSALWHMHFKRLIVEMEFIRRFDYCDGFIYIFNGTHVNNMEILISGDLNEMQEMLHVMQKGFGARVKQIHIISKSKMITSIIAFWKQLVSEKIVSRIYTHETLDALYDFVPKDILPEEYGGKEKSIKELNGNWLDQISSEDHLEYLKTLQDMKTDESRRSTIKFNEQYLGTPGTFRNLAVD